MEQLAVLLDQSAQHLARLDSEIWPALVSEPEISAEGLYLVRSVIQDVQSSLDWLATAVDRKFGKNSDRSPYFPLRPTVDDFERAFGKDFPGVAHKAPEVHRAMAACQPYMPGHRPLGYLHDLARVNKHQEFTKQTRDEREHWSVDFGGFSIQFNAGRGLRIGGPPPYGHLISGHVAGTPEGEAGLAQGLLVTWNFAALGEPVQPTLVRLHDLASRACEDVYRAGDFQ